MEKSFDRRGLFGYLGSKYRRAREVVDAGGGVDLATLAREPFYVDGMQVSPLAVGHSKRAWELQGERASEAVGAFNGDLCFEYLFAEYRHIRHDSNPVFEFAMSTYDDRNKLFEELGKISLDDGKQLWMLDPAYSEEFIYLELLLSGLPMAAASLPVGYGVTRKLWRAGDELPGEQMTRREFVAWLGTVGAVAAIASGGAASATWKATRESVLGVENDLRQAVIAQHLISLSQHQLAPRELLKVYPEWHLKGIIANVEDEEKRMKQLKIGKQFEALGWDELFVARRYVMGDGKWIRQGRYWLNDRLEWEERAA